MAEEAPTTTATEEQVKEETPTEAPTEGAGTTEQAPASAVTTAKDGEEAENAALAVQNRLQSQALPIRAYLDQTVVPYMRGQTIQFSAQGMKPLTNVYVFFGDVDEIVTQHTHGPGQ